MSMPQLQNLGLSGYAWVGVDVGGFSGDATGELLARWTEFGIFQPFCRNHSAWDTHPQEPWAFGPRFEALIKDALLLRQRLVPYLYSLFDEAQRTGAPILRPLLFEFPDDATTFSTDDQFMLGPALLVAPIARPGTEYRHVYLPRGTWAHYWSGESVTGPAHVLVHAPLGQPALYVRANVPLPLGPSTLHDGDPARAELTWLVCAAPAEAGQFTLYEDAGDGYGAFSRTAVSCRTDAVGVHIELSAPDGSYAVARNEVELDIRGIQRPARVMVNGKSVDDWQHGERGLTLRLPSGRAARLDLER
jgi:alpha-glucosidase